MTSLLLVLKKIESGATGNQWNSHMKQPQAMVQLFSVTFSSVSGLFLVYATQPANTSCKTIYTIDLKSFQPPLTENHTKLIQIFLHMLPLALMKLWYFLRYAPQNGAKTMYFNASFFLIFSHFSLKKPMRKVHLTKFWHFSHSVSLFQVQMQN